MVWNALALENPTMTSATTLPPPAPLPAIGHENGSPLVETVLPRDGDDILYEVVNGQRVELTPMGHYETRIASILDQWMGPYARTQDLGRVLVETLFRIDPARAVDRRPDLAFVSFRRWAKDRRLPRSNAAPVVPDLAVEVISPTDLAAAVLAKVEEYFRAGVEQVWLIWPDAQQVYVYTALNQISVRTRTDDLDGGALLPGFRLPIATLFEDAPEPSEPSPSGSPA